MKKIISILSALLILLTFSACGSDKSMSLDDVKKQITDDGKLCGMIYLGKYESVKEFTEKFSDSHYSEKYPFLKDVTGDKLIEANEGKMFFAIIPADNKSLLAVNKYDGDGESDYFYMGDELYVAQDGAAIIIKCNLSEASPDTLVTVVKGDGSRAEFCPSVSGKGDKSALTAEQQKTVYDLTDYKK